MLMLSRKLGDEILIGDNIRLVVNRIVGNRVMLGIAAPTMSTSCVANWHRDANPSRHRRRTNPC